jgi:metal-responsive CopG/Arc/MetJ family transcriptional regulator
MRIIRCIINKTWRWVMSTNTVRLNITLPSELAEDLKQITGPRRRSQFVAEAVEQKIKKLKDRQMEKAMAEGYQATRKEGLAIAKEFEASDIEGWDEY